MIRSSLLTPVQPQPRRLRFSVDDYYKMIDLGMIEDYERAEIIDGEMVPKMTSGDRHAAVVNLLNRFLSRNVPESVMVSIRNPLRLSDFDEPEPDIVLADLTKYDGKRHPRPEEVILVIEVADASLKYDRDIKLPLYAESQIPEVWIVNLQKNIVEIHRNPNVGIYQTAQIFQPDETIQSEALPDLRLPAREILG